MRVDYTGMADSQMLRLWKNLSSSAATMANIPNLIWMDMAANAFVGTKSMITATPPTEPYSVQMYRHRITYNYLYGIPGFISWAAWAVLVFMSLYLLLSPRSRSRVLPPSLRSLINQLSVGRALVAAQKPDGNLCHPDAPTKAWVAEAGRIIVGLSEGARVADMGNDGAKHRPCSVLSEESITSEVTITELLDMSASTVTPATEGSSQA
jgi:hypothetical protein